MSLVLDCSLEAQDERRKLLEDLLAKRFSGVKQITDRNRSVTYHDAGDLARLIRDLRQQLEYCETGTITGPRRIFYLGYNKWH